MVKNQLRAVINVVKSKAAAIHYEDHMAELYATGADVRDFSHSLKMFMPMIKAIDAYFDNQVSSFLARPLANTGLPPHYHVTADKPQNHKPNDLKHHTGVEDERILYMVGKVTDGQYINEGFVEGMNNALWKYLPSDVQDEFLWPLDKIIDKFMDS